MGVCISVSCTAAATAIARRAALLALLLPLLFSSATLAEERAEPRFYAPKPIADPGHRRISVGLLAGYGATLDTSATDGLNAFGPGFGLRGGYDIDPIYLGVRLLFFVGDSRAIPDAELKFDETTIGVDVGVDAKWDGVTLRSQLGVGLAMSSAELAVDGALTADRSSDDLYLAPGVCLLVDVTQAVFLGAEAHLPIILRERTLYGVSFSMSGGLRL